METQCDLGKEKNNSFSDDSNDEDEKLNKPIIIQGERGSFRKVYR